MKLLRDPLLHFLLLGGALFLGSALLSHYLSPDEERRIEISEAEIEFLAAGWQRQWQRAPTEEELARLVESRVREEILYREAVGMGLDRNDTVVRRRMVQKMELLSQDLALMADPLDEELQAYLEERRDDYRVPPRVSFNHVYLNPDRRGPEIEAEAGRLLAELRAGSPSPGEAAERGDRFMLQQEFELRTPLELRQLFGAAFAESLTDLEPGWHGPVVSGYGLHLVNVTERLPGRLPELEEIRSRIISDYNRVRRDRANQALYDGLADGYRIEIDEEAVRRSALPSQTAD
jgi:peptidyl-prolyl cis-trans isomerase C